MILLDRELITFFHFLLPDFSFLIDNVRNISINIALICAISTTWLISPLESQYWYLRLLRTNHLMSPTAQSDISKKTRAKLTEAQCAARKTRSVALTEAINSFVAEHRVKVAEIARTHGR